MIRTTFAFGTIAFTLVGCGTSIDSLFSDTAPPATAIIADPVVVSPRDTDTAWAPDEMGTAPLPRPRPPITPAEVMAIQEALARLGHDPGTVDGLIGPRTSTAIRIWQTTTGRPIDGKITRAVAASLREQIAATTVRDHPAPAPAPNAEERGVISRFLRPLFGD